MFRPSTFSHRAHLGRLLALLAGLALAAQAAVGVQAQVTGPSLTITDVDSEAFPSVTAHLTVTGANGLPLVGLSETNFTVLEDGKAVAAGDLVLDSDSSQPLYLVLGVDLAMPAAELLAVQTALRDFTDGLDPQDQVALLTFADQVVVVQDFTSDKVALATAIGGLVPGGNGTLFNQATDTAVTVLGRLPPGRKAVLLFTDSGDTANTVSPEATLSKAQAGRVSLYPFAFGDRVNGTIMNNWARFTGGQAYLLAAPGEIQPNLETLGVLLRQSYRLSYTSGVTADNARHELSIELDYEDQTAVADNRFVAVPGEVTIEGLTIGNGQTLRGMVFLIADVNAPAPVESVTFMLDGETLVELTTPPYRFDWDTATAGAGTHAVTVLARDAAGNLGETQVSVNVAVPAPVAPTAAPVPTPVPTASPLIGFARSVLNIGRILLVGAVLLGAFIGALLLWLRSRKAQAPEPVTGCRLELVNRGNARTQYELRAEDPAKLMKFSFLVNDAGLAMRRAAAVSGPAALAQVAPAAGVAQAPAGATKGKPEKPERKHKGLQQPKMIKKAQNVAFSGVGIAARISGWVMAVTYMLPGNAALKMRGQAARFRGDIDVVDDAAKAPDRYRHIIDDVVPVDAINEKLGAGKDKAARARASANAPAATAVATLPAGSSNGAPTMVGGAAALAAAPTAVAAPQQPSLVSMRATTAGWALTPPIEPGATLVVNLHISPLRVPKTEIYGFRVLSRAAEASDKTKLTQIEHGSVALTAVPWHKQLLPWLLFIVMLGTVALFGWYVLSTLGVVGAG